MWATVAIVLTGLITVIWLWSKNTFSKFRKYGIPEAKAWFPFGSSPGWQMMSGTPFTKIYNDLYNQFKDERMVGFYGPMGSLQLLVIDLDLAKTVLVKDFEYMQDRREMPKFQNVYVDNMLTILDGEKWRQARSIVTPIFTSGKLKLMLPLVNQVGDKFVTYLDNIAEEGLEVEAKELMTKFSLEVIASTALGVEAHAFSDPDGIFSDRVDCLTASGKYQRTALQSMRVFLFGFFLGKLGNLFPKKWRQFIDLDAVEFFAKIIKTQMEDRRKNPSQRHDFIDTLTQAVESESRQDRTVFKSKEDLETCVIANALVMFFAGFDTTSSNLSLCAFFLAKKPECQEKAYQEVKEAIDANNGNEHLDYATVQELPYLDACLTESLRAYPSLIAVNLERRVNKPYKIPGTEMTLPKDTLLVVPGAAIHSDKRYWETPDKFNPDHFLAEVVNNRSPFASANFGHGPRNCVGKRLAILQSKVAMVRLLANYRIVTCSKTVDEMVPDIKSMSMLPKGGMWIKIEKRDLE